MPKSSAFNIRDIYTIDGTEDRQPSTSRTRWRCTFRACPSPCSFRKRWRLQGAPTCSIGISPYGLYNRLNDAGRLIMLNQKAVQFGSAPFVRVGDKLHNADPEATGRDQSSGDDIPAIKNYYPPPVDAKERLAHHRHAVGGDRLQDRKDEDHPPADLAAAFGQRADADADRR